MTPDLAFGLSREMLWVAARVAGPIIVTSMAVGLVISIFQVVTQIQEMTLTFIPKLFAIFLLLLLAGPWMLATLVEFGVAIISGIPNYIN